MASQPKLLEKINGLFKQLSEVDAIVRNIESNPEVNKNFKTASRIGLNNAARAPQDYYEGMENMRTMKTANKILLLLCDLEATLDAQIRALKEGLGSIPTLTLKENRSYLNEGFQIGDTVKDINPECPHYGAIGTVTDYDGLNVTFKVINSGKTYKMGDMLTKTPEQLQVVKEDLHYKNLETKLDSLIRSISVG